MKTNVTGCAAALGLEPPGSVLGDQYLHIVQVALDVMAVNTAPGPDNDIDMIIGRIVEQIAGGGNPWCNAVDVDVIPRAQIGTPSRYAVIIKIQRTCTASGVIEIIPGAKRRVAPERVHAGDDLAAMRGMLVGDMQGVFDLGYPASGIR